ALQGVQLRVLLTSRPEVPIQYGFTQVRREEHRDFVLHDIEPAVIEHDIAVFLRHQLGLVRQKCRLEAGWAEEGAIARLVQNSGGLFIWAATACRFIEEDSQLAEARLVSLLEQGGDGMLPPERKLDEIYTIVLTSSMRGEYTEAESQTLHEQFRQVVGPVVTMQDPLSVVKLAELLRKDVATLRRTLANLQSVLDVPDADSSAIRLLHPSFRDFLLSPSRCSNPQFRIDERTVHGEMHKHCLEVMSKHLRRDMCSLKDPGARTADLSQIEVDRHIPAHVQYACRFWVYHCRRSGIDTGNCCDVEVFFHKHFLHWLESLALLGRVSEAVAMVHALHSMFPTNQKRQFKKQSNFWERMKLDLLWKLNLEANSTSTAPLGKALYSLEDVVHDATRFVLAFWPVLEEAPLQVYYACLVFSPKSSVIREVFSKEAPGWLVYMPEVLENWGACLQTLKGHSLGVNAVAFSPDGKTLASASTDRTAKVWNAGSGKALQTLNDHSDKVYAVAFSPDGKTLASASDDGTVQVWDARSGKALQTLNDHSDQVYAVAFSPDGKTMASRSGDGTIKVWDARSGKALQTLKGHPYSLTAIAFSPDGKTLASASWGKVEVWDAGSGKALQMLKGHSQSVTAIAFSSDGKTLASASDDKTVKVWNAGSGKALQTLKGHSDVVNAMAFSPDGKTLASASRDKTVKVWNAESGKALQTLKGHSSFVNAVAFSPDGKTLASASTDRTVKVWDAGSGKALQTPKGHSQSVTAIAFSPDGKMLASASDDKTVKVWNAGSGKALQTLKGHSDVVNAMAFSPDGKTLASASRDKTVKVWDVGSGKALQTLKGHSYSITAIAFSPDGKTLASASWDKTVKVWDAGSGKALQTLKGHSSVVSAVAFSPDGKTLASASDDKTVKVWDAGSGKALQTLKGHSSEVNAVAFSSNGKTLASASTDVTVKVWDAGSGKALQTLDGYTLGFNAAAFSPDGKMLASASDDRTVKVWDARSGKALQTLNGHSDVVNAVAFSPDGKTLASASRDRTAKVWDAGSGKALQTLKGHSGGVKAVAFSPDGKTLASASDDRTVKVWDAGSSKALQTLKGHSSFVTAVAFSPDGKTLASASDDKTVKVWNAESGKALQTLKGHSYLITAIAFSPDGKTLASASNDRTVKVWDAGSGKALQTLKTDFVVQKLWFNVTGDRLWSDKGLLLTTGLPNNGAPCAASTSLSISGEEWVCWNGKRVLWLPSEYRSSFVAVHGNTVGFGHYGPIVRIAPNELALAFEGVWDKVQGGTYDNEIPKLNNYYRVQADQTEFIMTAPPEDHAQMRRALSYGFSDRGIRDMESRMIEMLDKMLGRLNDICSGRDGIPNDPAAQRDEAVIDIAKWCNFLTFDMIGELAFGESYNCLETASYHPWVRPIVHLTHYSGVLAVLGFYPKFQTLLLNVFGSLICRRMESHQQHSRDALERRGMRPDRTDLLSQSLKQAKASKDPVAWDKLVMNASVLGVAGSETTATTITAAFYFLLTNPRVYQQLSTEVRNAFKDETEITVTAVNKLEYMLACLNETMRMLPAVPGGLPRVVPLGGKVFHGEFVPQGTIVSIWHWALYHNDAFFRAPFEFRPERFLGVADFSSDARQLLQPFHVGRRACIGRS
ncbi:putative WD repeat-containing protein, partial [Alternaria tenuissima]